MCCSRIHPCMLYGTQHARCVDVLACMLTPRPAAPATVLLLLLLQEAEKQRMLDERAAQQEV